MWHSIVQVFKLCVLNIFHLGGYPPKIVKSTPSCVRVVEGYSTILTCEADGDPVPVISWMFDDKPVKGSRYIVANGTVKISPVLSIDDGIYW